MKYIVLAVKFKDGKNKNDIWTFDDLEDAKDFAEWKRTKLKEHGYDYFNVFVYERVYA